MGCDQLCWFQHDQRIGHLNCGFTLPALPRLAGWLINMLCLPHQPHNNNQTLTVHHSKIVTTTPTATRIQPATIEDASDFRNLWQEIYQECGELVGMPPPLQKIEAMISKMILANTPLLLMFDQRKLIGAIAVLVKPTTASSFASSSASLSNKHSISNKHSAEVSIMLKKSYRHQGLAKQLATKAIQSSKASGINQLIAEIYPDNTPSLELARKLGFQPKKTMAGGKILLVLRLTDQ